MGKLNQLCRKYTIFTFVFVFFSCFTTTSAGDTHPLTFEYRSYGPFHIFTEMPSVMFFVGNIERGQLMGLRKALRNEDIRTVVLASDGGSVSEGLVMAGVIFDKKIETLVLQDSSCMSACSFMFFAGNNRKIDGQLGIHQFYSSDRSKSENVGDTEQLTQFTTSEIVGYLNEFNVPPFIYERMFSETEMYYLDERDIQKVENSDSSFLKQVDTIYNFLKKLEEDDIKDQKPEESEQPTPDVELSEDLYQKIGTQLDRLGCRGDLGKNQADGLQPNDFSLLFQYAPDAKAYFEKGYRSLYVYLNSLPRNLCVVDNSSSYDPSIVKKVEMKLEKLNCLSSEIDGSLGYTDLFDLFRHELLTYGEIRFEKSPPSEFLSKILKESGKDCLMTGQVKAPKDVKEFSNQGLREELERTSCLANVEDGVFQLVGGVRALTIRLHDMVDLRRLNGRGLVDVLTSSSNRICESLDITAKNLRIESKKDYTKKKSINTAPIDLEGAWGMIAHCRNSQKVVGSIELFSKKNSEGVDMYNLSYTNDLGMSGVGTLADSPNSVKFNVTWTNTNLQPNLEGSGTFTSVTKRQLVGTSSDGCSFVVTKVSDL